MVNLQGKILEGTGKWHGESWIHICIYRARPEINGVVPTHSLSVTALATAEAGFIPATIFGTAFADSKTYTKAGLTNTEERGIAMANLMGNSAALLLKAMEALLPAPPWKKPLPKPSCWRKRQRFRL